MTLWHPWVGITRKLLSTGIMTRLLSKMLIYLPKCIWFQLPLQWAEGVTWFHRTAIRFQIVDTPNCVSVCNQFLQVFESFCFNQILTCHCHWLVIVIDWCHYRDSGLYLPKQKLLHYHSHKIGMATGVLVHTEVWKAPQSQQRWWRKWKGRKGSMGFPWSRQDQPEYPQQQSSACVSLW